MAIQAAKTTKTTLHCDNGPKHHSRYWQHSCGGWIQWNKEQIAIVSDQRIRNKSAGMWLVQRPRHYSHRSAPNPSAICGVNVGEVCWGFQGGTGSLPQPASYYWCGPCSHSKISEGTPCSICIASKGRWGPRTTCGARCLPASVLFKILQAWASRLDGLVITARVNLGGLLS